MGRASDPRFSTTAGCGRATKSGRRVVRRSSSDSDGCCPLARRAASVERPVPLRSVPATGAIVDPARLQQGRQPGGARLNDHAGRSASSKRYLSISTGRGPAAPRLPLHRPNRRRFSVPSPLAGEGRFQRRTPPLKTRNSRHNSYILTTSARVRFAPPSGPLARPFHRPI